MLAELDARAVDDLAADRRGIPVRLHVLSFEGPDDYSRAGGISSRITGLTRALADSGFDTFLWFIGDPRLPGAESRGNLHLRRWCQWISEYHPGGVYDGEDGKRTDFASSLPPYLVREHLLPFLDRERRQVVVLAEEWQTADAVLHLDWLLRQAGVRNRVAIFWNANNTFGFERIDWARLREAAVITTVSRYMRQLMWGYGVDPLVIPNGLCAEAYDPPDHVAMKEFRRRVSGRTVLAKVARWDPDKRWLLAVDTVGELKRHNRRPLLLARGGVERHGAEVFERAAQAGLRVVERTQSQPGVRGLIESLTGIDGAEVVSLRSPLSAHACRVLFRGADAVLANSGHEPFGLVGLETMAVGGLACTGGTGEDYAVSGWNGLVLQRQDPKEFLSYFHRLQSNPEEERRMRWRARSTAKRYAWEEIVRRGFLPHVPHWPDRKAVPAAAQRRAHPHRARRVGAAFTYVDQASIAARAVMAPESGT